MGDNINRVILGFGLAFFVAIGAITVYEVVWAGPGRACVTAHKWWDGDRRVCATPIELKNFTGRPNKAAPMIGPGAKPVG